MLSHMLKMLRLVEAGAVETNERVRELPPDSNVYCLRHSRRTGPILSVGSKLVSAQPDSQKCLYQSSPQSQIRDFLIRDGAEHTDVVLCGVTRHDCNPSVMGWIGTLEIAGESRKQSELMIKHEGHASIRSICWLPEPLGSPSRIALAGDYEGNLLRISMETGLATPVGRLSSQKAIRTINVYRGKEGTSHVVCGLADTSIEIFTTEDLGSQSIRPRVQFKLEYDSLHTVVTDHDGDSPKLAIADSGGNVSIIEHDGRIIWRHYCGAKVLSLCTYPAQDGESQRLIAGTSRGEVICVSDHRVEWSYPVGKCVFALDVEVEPRTAEQHCSGPKIWAATDKGQVKSLYPVNRRYCLREAKKVISQASAATPTAAYLGDFSSAIEELCRDATASSNANRSETSAFIADELVRVINSQGLGIAQFVSLAMSNHAILSDQLCDRLNVLSRDHQAQILQEVLMRPRTNLLIKLLTLLPDRYNEIVPKLPQAVSSIDHRIRLAKEVERALAQGDRDTVDRNLYDLDKQDGIDLTWHKRLPFTPVFFRVGKVSVGEHSAFVQTSTDLVLRRVSRTAGIDWSFEVGSPITGMTWADVSGNDKKETLVSTVDGRILAINSTSGERIWELALPARVMAFEVNGPSLYSDDLHLIAALQTGEVYYETFKHGDAPLAENLARVGFTLRPIRTIKIRPISATEARVIWLQSDCTMSAKTLDLTTGVFGQETAISRHGLPLRLTISEDGTAVYVASNMAIYRHDILELEKYTTIFESSSGQIVDFGLVQGEQAEGMVAYIVQANGQLTLCDRDGTPIESRTLPQGITRPGVYRPLVNKPIQLTGYVGNEIRNWHLEQREWIKRLREDAVAHLNDTTALEQFKQLHAADAELKTIDRVQHEISVESKVPIALLVPCWTIEDKSRLLPPELSIAPSPCASVGAFCRTIPCNQSTIIILDKVGAPKPVVQHVCDLLLTQQKSVIIYFVGTGAELHSALLDAGVRTESCGLSQYSVRELEFLFLVAGINQPDKLAKIVCAATLGIPSLVLELIRNMTSQAHDGQALTAVGAAEASIIDLNRSSLPKTFKMLWENLELTEQILISSEFLIPDQAEGDVMARMKDAKLYGREHEELLESLGLLRKKEAWGVHLPIWPWIGCVQQYRRVATIVLNRLAEMPKILGMQQLAHLARSLNSFPKAVESLTQRSKTILKMAPAWQRLCDGLGAETKAPLQDLLTGIAELCGLELWAVEYESESELAFGLFDMEPIGLRCTVDTLWVFVSHGKELALATLLKKRRTTFRDPIFLLTSNDADLSVIPEDQRRSLAILKESDFLQLLTSEGQERTNACLDWLIEYMTKSLPLKVISPYHSGDHPNMAVFVGREDILETLRSAATGNAILIGPRRAGKTSILWRLGQVTRGERQRSLSKQANDTDEWFRPIYIDVATTSSTQEACERLIEAIGGEGNSVASLAYELRRLRRFQNAQVLFLIDEVDKLFRNDRRQAAELFWQLRGLSNENLCRFVCAGFVDLYDETTNRESSFFNFGREIFVGSLTQDEAHQLISLPIERLRIRFDDKDACLRIISYETTNHPSYIHKVCENLMDMLAVDESGVVTKEKCAQAIREVKLADVFQITFEDLNPLTQLVLTVFPHGREYHKALNAKQVALDERLQGLAIPSAMVRKALRSAVMAGFLAVEDGMYQMHSEKLGKLVRELAPPLAELRAMVREAVRKFESS